jgi:hypothetical protein
LVVTRCPRGVTVQRTFMSVRRACSGYRI